MRAFQSDLFREMAQAIERYEGFVEKFVGDAVMAVFGAPMAHDDDPERGLHAALAMQERMGELNRRWARRVGRTLALHVGLNTGPVVAGTLGAAADGAYAVTGDTVNTASRLQSAAESSEILVAESTRRLSEHPFAIASRGTLSLKGKREPVDAYRVLGALCLRLQRLQRAGLGADVMGMGPSSGGGARAEGVHVAYAHPRVRGARSRFSSARRGHGSTGIFKVAHACRRGISSVASATDRRLASSR